MSRLALLVFSLAAATVFAAQGQPTTPPIDSNCERLFPAALIARATGQPKAALIPRNPRIAAGGNCNWVDDPSAAKPRVMLLADINTVADHQEFEKYAGQTTMKAIPGLGDESSATETIVVARKGKLLVVVSAFQQVDMNTMATKPWFTQAQLIDLVRQALAKG